jgi:hypothetical protein
MKDAFKSDAVKYIYDSQTNLGGNAHVFHAERNVFTFLTSFYLHQRLPFEIFYQKATSQQRE